MSLDSGLVGLWKFNGDCNDSSGKGNHGRPFGVDFSAVGRSGKSNTAAAFDGVDDCVEVRSNESLALGTGDFTLAAWIRLEEDLTDIIGDVASKFDEVSRRGFNLYVKGSSAAYNSYGDAKNVHFGIDNAMDAPWEDCGRPWPTNTYVSSLTVFKGDLYAGIADAIGDGTDACHVFRYAGGTEWIDCGRVGDSLRTRSAYSMIVHKDHLYCGTGRYDWVTVTPENCDYVRVYRYEGGTKWIDCGRPGENYRILSLCSFKGDLYCGTDDNQRECGPEAGKVFRYAGGTEWVDCGRLGDKIRSFCVFPHNGVLYGSTDGDIFRYEGGTDWTYIGNPFHNTQVHCLQICKGKLYAGTWPQGYVCSYEGGMQWSLCGRLGVTTGEHQRMNEINDLTVYNGKLYAGVIPKGEVYRYEGGTSWTLLRRLVSNPDWKPKGTATWARVPSLTVFDGKLYTATAACRGYAEENPHYEVGRVYSTTAGQNVSYDQDLGSGWSHVVAVREGGTLKLYIDGRLVSSSQPFAADSYDLTNNEPLYIGFGAVDYFSGVMDEMRLYSRALSRSEVAELYKQPAE